MSAARKELFEIVAPVIIHSSFLLNELKFCVARGFGTLPEFVSWSGDYREVVRQHLEPELVFLSPPLLRVEHVRVNKA